MGMGSWSSSDWNTYSSTTKAKPAAEIFRSSKIHADLDPATIKMREARDSEFNPNSTPLIVATDVTGSMGMLAENLIKTGLGVVFKEILDRKPITDPQLMIMAVGDGFYDRAPLQVSQFEADMRITQQLEKVYVEGGGGGNGFESYDLPYVFAAFRTEIDSYIKRGKKGYLFTIGDEPPPNVTSKHILKNFLNEDIQEDLPFSNIIAKAEEYYNCFHIIVAQGSHIRYSGLDSVKRPWTALLGERAVVLEDIASLAETIVSIIQVTEGASVDDVVNSWSGNTGLVVKTAISDLAVRTTSSGLQVL